MTTEPMLADLLAEPGVREELDVGSRFGVMAFHGGSLERMTDRLADEVAARSGASRYVVRQPEHLRWHVPSRLFDPAHSHRLARFVGHVQVAVALHGYGRAGSFRRILLGGTNRGLAADVAAELRARTDHYEIVDDLDAIPTELRGLHPSNPVNRVAGGGVQLELPPRARGLGPYWAVQGSSLGVDGLNPHSAAVVDALAAVASRWCETWAP